MKTYSKTHHGSHRPLSRHPAARPQLVEYPVPPERKQYWGYQSRTFATVTSPFLDSLLKQTTLGATTQRRGKGTCQKGRVRGKEPSLGLFSICSSQVLTYPLQMESSGTGTWSEKGQGEVRLLRLHWGVHRDWKVLPCSISGQNSVLPRQGTKHLPGWGWMMRAPSPQKPHTDVPSTLVDLNKTFRPKITTVIYIFNWALYPTLLWMKAYSKTSQWESPCFSAPKGWKGLKLQILSQFATDMLPTLVISPHKATW